MKIRFLLIFFIFFYLNQSIIVAAAADSNVFIVEDCLNEEENSQASRLSKVINCTSINTDLANCTCADDYIDCSRRKFFSIPTNLTRLPAQIKRLLFASNQIKSLVPLDFGNQSAVEITTLDLKKNQIDYIDPQFFSDSNIYDSLNFLSFCGNSNLTSLNSLNSNFSFKKLEALEINNLKVAFEINDNLFNKQRFPILKKLDLNNASIIFKGKQPFKNLDELVSLRLDSNKLAQIPCQAISEMTSLTVLNLNLNRIKPTANEACFKNLNKLDQLHLSSSGLTNSDLDIFDFSPNIQVLDLSNNKLDNFPDNLLQNVKKLNYLRIKINQEQFMTQPLNKKQEEIAWPDMTHLDLTDSVIYKLPEKAFIHLSLSISDLILKNCQLKEIDKDAFFGLKNLFGLDLSNNNLKKLEKPSSDGQFDYNMLKGNLKLDKNKFSCEQIDVEWFIHFYDFPSFDKKLTCSLKNNTLINTHEYLQAHRVYPQTSRFNVLTIILLILIVLVIATTILYFVRRNHVKQRQQQYRYRYFTERSQDDGFDTDNVPVYRDCTVSLKIKDTDDNQLETSSTAALTSRGDI